MTDDEKAIHGVIDTWLRSTAAGDTATVLTLMADDVVFLTPGQPPFGKKEFAAVPPMVMPAIVALTRVSSAVSNRPSAPGFTPAPMLAPTQFPPTLTWPREVPAASMQALKAGATNDNIPLGTTGDFRLVELPPT